MLDDMAWQRWAHVGWVGCGRLSGVLLGMQVVLLIGTEGKWKAPIGGRGGPSKIE